MYQMPALLASSCIAFDSAFVIHPLCLTFALCSHQFEYGVELLQKVDDIQGSFENYNIKDGMMFILELLEGRSRLKTC